MFGELSRKSLVSAMNNCVLFAQPERLECPISPAQQAHFVSLKWSALLIG